MFAIFVFALALSMDGLGMGLSYGLRRIRIRLFPLLLICFSSALAISISMFLGKTLGSFFPEKVAALLGAVILILVGLWIIIQNYYLKKTDVARFRSKRFRNSRLGMMLTILKEPFQADLNRSGEIDLKEAVLLGSALALDALGAGLGAAMSGYNLLWTPIIVAVVELIMINLGIIVGGKLRINGIQKNLAFIPGVIIVVLGITKLLC